MTDSSLNERLIIRADADSHMGSGHIMRCVALAQAWQGKGGKVVFLSYIEGKSLQERILSQGFELFPINAPWPNPENIETVANFFKTLSPHDENWIILDGYHFNPEYQLAIKDTGCKILIIDDMAHHLSYHCDILLNPNIYATIDDYPAVKSNCTLMGSQYALLRKEFLNIQTGRTIKKQANKILITMGGADPQNFTLTVLKAFKLIQRTNLKIKIIVGPVNKYKTCIRKEIDQFPHRVELMSNVTDMPAVMKWADLAITGGGGTCWELSLMGTPSLVVILAKNQKRIATSLNRLKISINCGEQQDITPEGLSEIIYKFLGNQRLRKQLSQNSQNLFDGLGPDRIINNMVCYK